MGSPLALAVAGSPAVLITLLPHLIILGLMLLSMALFALRNLRRGPYAPSANVNPTVNVLIPRFAANWFFWLLDGCLSGLLRLKLTPNQISLLSTLAGALSGAAYALGWFGAAGWLLILSGALDMMDGWVARATGKTSKSGDFLDAVLDRYVEILVFVGLGFYYRFSWWMMMACALAISGSMMVSYTRARGEILGVVYDKGIFQRAERMVWLAVVTVFAPPIQLWIDGGAARPFYWPVAGLVMLTAVLATLGGLHRTIALTRILDRLPEEPAAGAPAVGDDPCDQQQAP